MVVMEKMLPFAIAYGEVFEWNDVITILHFKGLYVCCMCVYGLV